MRYLKPEYKRLARIMFETHGISARNPAHVFAYCESNSLRVIFQPEPVPNKLPLPGVVHRSTVEKRFSLLLSCLREYEAKQLGFASEAARIYAEAQGKAPKTGETVSVYV